MAVIEADQLPADAAAVAAGARRREESEPRQDADRLEEIDLPHLGRVRGLEVPRRRAERGGRMLGDEARLELAEAAADAHVFRDRSM